MVEERQGSNMKDTEGRRKMVEGSPGENRSLGRVGGKSLKERVRGAYLNNKCKESRNARITL